MKKRSVSLSILAMIFLIAACNKNSSITQPPVPVPPPVAPTPELLFNTGFESGVTMISTGAQFAEFRGADATVPKPNDFVADFVAHPNVGLFRIYYEQGDSSKRLASIVADPVTPTNKVLNFKINTPHIDVPAASQYTINGILFDKKARIQADMYNNSGLKEIYQTVRLFIPTDFNKIVASAYPGNGDWITLLEFWNNNTWTAGQAYPFRFGVNLDKGTATAGSPLYFKAEGQKFAGGTYTSVWNNKAAAFPVPIGKWMTLDYYVREGNTANGRFYFAVTPDGGPKTVVFDLQAATCHPDDPAPDGLVEINPLKLYTSNNMVNQMNAAGGIFQVYWDDFKIWKNKRP